MSRVGLCLGNYLAFTHRLWAWVLKLWRLWHRIIGFLKMFVWFLSNLQGLHKKKNSFSRKVCEEEQRDIRSSSGWKGQEIKVIRFNLFWLSESLVQRVPNQRGTEESFDSIHCVWKFPDGYIILFQLHLNKDWRRLMNWSVLSLSPQCLCYTCWSFSSISCH